MRIEPLVGAEPIAFIVNPVAGATRHAGLDDLIRDEMEAAGRAATIRHTAGPGDGVALAREAADAGCRIVVAVGGDGTVNEVARGILGTGAALGIVPCGSGNGLARHLAVPLSARAALSRFSAPRFQRMDVGRINGRPFFCTAGLGFDAHVSRCFAAAPRRGLGTYARVTLGEFRSYRPIAVSVTVGETRIECDCYLLAFANASQYGNNTYIAPHADIADGLLDLCFIDELSVWRALRVGYALARGTLPASGAALYHTANSVRVVAERPIGFHVDGDYVGTDVAFEVELTNLELEIAI